MSKRSPRPRTTRRGPRPAAESPPPAAPIPDELPSIILADDLLAEPPPEPDLGARPEAPLAAAPDTPDPAEDRDDPVADPPLDPDLAAPGDEPPRTADSEPSLEPGAEAHATLEPEGPPPRAHAPLARAPLAPRPLAQRYAPAYDESAPAEIPRYVEEEPRRSWRPPEPAQSPVSALGPRVSDDVDLEIDFRSSRRKYNWLLVLACVIVGILGVVLGSRPGDTPTTPGQAGATAENPDASNDTGPDASTAETASAEDATSAADTPTPAVRPDVSPPNPRAARALDEAKRALDERRWDGALLELDRALAEAPDNPRALFGRARALHQLGRHDEALRDANAVLAADPAHPYALLLAAEALEKRGLSAEARAYYERYLAAWPKTRKAEELRKALGTAPGK